MAVTASSEAMGASSSRASLNALDGVNFFLAALQSGFGPFVAVLLADEKWSQQSIGFVLSVGGFAGLLSQLPGGELLDAIRSKRFLIASGAIMVAVGALAIALWPTRPVVFAALVLQGLTGGLLGPAIAAVSLGLVGHSGLAERLGRNQRFASAGALTAAAVMGVIGYFLSYRAIFLASAALVLPLLAALSQIRASEIHFGRACGQPDHHAPTPPPRIPRVTLWKNYGLLVFAGSLFLFQFANAALLPLAGEQLAYRSGTGASLLVSALIVVPQIVVIFMAPWSGRMAETWGRRPLLLLGFSAFAVRALLFSVTGDPRLLLFVQLLDGITGSTLGVLTALVVADLTRGTGRFNLAQGLVGTLAGIGASLSTAFFSIVAGNFGATAGFVSIACAALVLVLIVWLWMPETMPAGQRAQDHTAPG